MKILTSSLSGLSTQGVLTIFVCRRWIFVLRSFWADFLYGSEMQKIRIINFSNSLHTQRSFPHGDSLLLYEKKGIYKLLNTVSGLPYQIGQLGKILVKWGFSLVWRRMLAGEYWYKSTYLKSCWDWEIQVSFWLTTLNLVTVQS